MKFLSHVQHCFAGGPVGGLVWLDGALSEICSEQVTTKTQSGKCLPSGEKRQYNYGVDDEDGDNDADDGDGDGGDDDDDDDDDDGGGGDRDNGGGDGDCGGHKDDGD